VTTEGPSADWANGEHAERFTHLRPLLFTIAYEILGSATESDDVLQDSYLRWANADLATVRDTKSYLPQLVTRQALNGLRANARRPWCGPLRSPGVRCGNWCAASQAGSDFTARLRAMHSPSMAL
jgi:DNA-directed RNA polymerase specialized sigma24 family protein